MSAEEVSVSDLLVGVVRKGDLECVRALIGSHGISCCEDKSRGYLLILVAITLDRVEIARFLFEAGVKVDPKFDGMADTLLQAAAQSRSNVELVHLLVENNACNGQNMLSLLCTAIKNESNDIIKLFLSPHAKDPKRGSLYLEEDECIRNLQQLLASGARFEEASELLLLAAKEGFVEMSKLLLANGVDVNYLNAKGQAALNLSCQSEFEYERDYEKDEIVALLLEGGANVCGPEQPPLCGPPLHVAVSGGRLTAVRLLLSAGADVNQRYAGRTALHVACSENSIEIVKILCKHKADVDACDAFGRSPVHKAEAGNVVEMLCKYGADCDARADKNETALHSICSRYPWQKMSYKISGTISALINNGCDINAETEGKTALDMIWSSSDAFRDDIEQLHLHGGPDPDDPYPDDPFDYMDYACQEIIISLKEQALKLRAAGLHVNQKNLDVFESVNGRLADYAQACTEEFARLKVKKFHELTLHSVLANRNPLYRKNESLMKELYSCSFEEFPIYRNLIIHSIRMSAFRLDLISVGVLVLRYIIKASQKSNGKEPLALPVEVLEEICSHLSNSQLKNLINCGNVLKRQSEIFRLRLIHDGVSVLRVIIKASQKSSGKEPLVLPRKVLEEICSHLSNPQLKNLIFCGNVLKPLFQRLLKA